MTDSIMHLAFKFKIETLENGDSNTILEHKKIFDANGKLVWGQAYNKDEKLISKENMTKIRSQINNNTPTFVFFLAKNGGKREVYVGKLIAIFEKEEITSDNEILDLIPSYYSWRIGTNENNIGVYLEMDYFQKINEEVLDQVHLISNGKKLSEIGGMSSRFYVTLPKDSEKYSTLLSQLFPYDNATEHQKQNDVYPRYSVNDALQDLFLNRDEFEEIMGLLEYKKNIILQGAAGVGKTFIAKRLAYSIMGEKNDDNIAVVQFHQSYSYEDFMQGYRPTEDGKFTLKNGIFYDFCSKAQKDKSGKKYFFIIDEINRGNLSKIFGEIMMLIESSKRGEDFSIKLTYSKDDETFFVPENVYVIGTMNTADRSLAMVDYALRRRFSFVTIDSKITSDNFQTYLKRSGLDEKLIELIISRISKLNKKITEDKQFLGKEYEIGHSYFCNINTLAPPDYNWYRRIIVYEIKPLLEEYWFDEPDKVQREIQQLLD